MSAEIFAHSNYLCCRGDITMAFGNDLFNMNEDQYATMDFGDDDSKTLGGENYILKTLFLKKTK